MSRLADDLVKLRQIGVLQRIVFAFAEAPVDDDGARWPRRIYVR